jgi:hypothetical protein
MYRKDLDPSRHSGQNLRRIAMTALLPALLAAAGCVDKDSQSSETTNKTTGTTPVEQTTTTLSEIDKQIQQIEAERKATEDAMAYADSAERDQRVAREVMVAGNRVVDLAESGEVGYFAFYNPTTYEWGRGTGNEGYGYLQHNPEYGGTETQMIVAVYQNSDGSFDRNSIKGVSISSPGQPAVGFEAPDHAATVLGLTTSAPQGWTVKHLPANPDIPGEYSSVFDASSGTPLDELMRIDSEALASLNQQISQFSS